MACMCILERRIDANDCPTCDAESEGDSKGHAHSEPAGELSGVGALHAWQGQDRPAHHAHHAAL